MSGRRLWRGIIVALVAIGVIVVAGVVWIAGGPGPMDFAGGRKVALADYRAANPAGVPAELAQADPVKRGDYLARAADCLVCHTAPGGKDYAGGLGFKLPFGTLYSTNITPDKETGIGNYSDQDFLNAVQRGIRHDGARLYPAMPFTSYTYMTDADALAIKAYLFSLAPVRAVDQPNTLRFPFNQRWGMALWSALFNPDTRFEPNTSQTPEWNRGAYLAEALLHCGECHTPRNLAFALDNREKFAGAVTAGWRAYNISSDKNTGIGAWRDEELIAYLAVDQSLSRLVPGDIRAVVAYLRTVPPRVSSDLPATLAPPPPASHKLGGGASDRSGKVVFEGACVACHGWTGTGEGAITPFAMLAGVRAVNDPAGINVAQIVISGTKRHVPEDAISMPAFGAIYSDAEIAAVTNFVIARFGGQASRITARDVAELRKQTAQ